MTQCKGLIFRYHQNRIFKNYKEAKKLWYKKEQTYKFYEFTRTYFAGYETLYFRKRDSCPGCETCAPIWKALNALDPHFENIKFDSLVPGKYYAFYLDSNNQLKLGEYKGDIRDRKTKLHQR